MIFVGGGLPNPTVDIDVLAMMSTQRFAMRREVCLASGLDTYPAHRTPPECAVPTAVADFNANRDACSRPRWFCHDVEDGR